MRSLTLDAHAVATSRRSSPSRPAPRTGALRRRRADRVEVPRAGDEEIRRLVLRARQGEADAFGILYDRYVDLVYRYVYYRVGSHSLAEDLTSETFLRALRGIGDFRWQGKDFGAWLVTIARNLVADHFKSSRFRLEVCTAELLEPDHPGVDRLAEDPARRVVKAMTHRALLEAVRRLNSEQQECIVLRFLHGLSVAETALIMGKKTGAVKALQYRAVRALARALPDDLILA
ncbi:sigma-70 family RNA polymerase sigma factor [Thermomonospora catenispora]|uniref:sigma-70 family RNA polymerase sigma factor n=1 Tax=Thermomonospora catenispora TaxID=2493090 RepID=UPI00112247C9|nr:sigma-70 family RNA polymerase sigma factor [Thermomonospora catenispora]TNY38914.1 sigma-70 family RNA polymerase sigma factor [Thermomonospora catenispora]